MNETKKTGFSSLKEFYNLHAGISFEKKSNFFKNIPKKYSWNVNFNEKFLIIENLKYSIQQMLGTYSLNAKSWVWGWANEQSNFPNELIDQTLHLKKLGIEKDILELKEGHFEIGEKFTEMIGGIACEIFKADTYVCINYGKGIFVATLKDEKIPKIDFNLTENIEPNFREIISYFNPENPEVILENYLLDRNIEIISQKDGKEAYLGKKILFSKAQFYNLENLRNLM